MSSVQCSHCQRWLSNRRNLMYHMASCPAKYNNNEDSLALLQHIPLKSSYDPHTSTKISVPCINDYTARLFEVDTHEIEGIWQIVLTTPCHFFPGTARIKPSIGRPKPVIGEASVSAATMTDFLKLNRRTQSQPIAGSTWRLPERVCVRCCVQHRSHNLLNCAAGTRLLVAIG